MLVPLKERRALPADIPAMSAGRLKDLFQRVKETGLIETGAPEYARLRTSEGLWWKPMAVMAARSFRGRYGRRIIQ